MARFSERKFGERVSNERELTCEVNELQFALKKGKPINIATKDRTDTRLGDTVIEVTTLFPILNKLTQKEGYPTPNFCHVPYYYGNETTFYSISQLKRAVDRLYGYEPVEIATLNKMIFVDILGFAVDFPHVGSIQKVEGDPYFGDFTRKRVESYVDAIIAELGPTIATVIQTGSEKVKRWSADQVIQVYENASLYLQQENIRGVILSDAALVDDIQSVAILSEYGRRNKVPVVFLDSSTGIELLTAFMGSTQILFSTDSAPGWIWCAEQSGKVDNGESAIIEDRNRFPYKKNFSKSRALIHHVLTDTYWAVPGADCYLSEAVRYTGNKAVDGFLLGLDREYRKWYGIKEKLHCPAQEDFEGYVQAQSRFLETL